MTEINYHNKQFLTGLLFQNTPVRRLRTAVTDKTRSQALARMRHAVANRTTSQHLCLYLQPFSRYFAL